MPLDMCNHFKISYSVTPLCMKSPSKLPKMTKFNHIKLWHMLYLRRLAWRQDWQEKELIWRDRRRGFSTAEPLEYRSFDHFGTRGISKKQQNEGLMERIIYWGLPDSEQMTTAKTLEWVTFLAWRPTNGNRRSFCLSLFLVFWFSNCIANQIIMITA